MLNLAILAAETGTTVAIVLALFTCIGTVSANIIAWHKIRSDSTNANIQMKQEQEVSKVEVAQTVMVQTVTTLNERLKNEFDMYESRLASMRAAHDAEIEEIKKDHKRDIDRLERKIERITSDLEDCRTHRIQLVEELNILKEERKT